jgi:hypothetical protein
MRILRFPPLAPLSPTFGINGERGVKEGEVIEMNEEGGCLIIEGEEGLYEETDNDEMLFICDDGEEEGGEEGEYDGGEEGLYDEGDKDDDEEGLNDADGIEEDDGLNEENDEEEEADEDKEVIEGADIEGLITDGEEGA